MRTLARALVGALAVTALAGARPAAAQDAPRPANAPLVPPSPSGPPAPAADDGALVLKQFGLATLGMAATVGAGAALTLLTGDEESRIFGFSALLAPTVAGLVVCGVGTWSVRYDGRCGAAVVGAYLGGIGGGLTGLLLGLSTCSNTTNSAHPDQGSTSDCGTAIAVGVIVGATLGTVGGGLIGWNISKQPKAPAPPRYDTPAASNASEDEHRLAVDRPAPPPLPVIRGAGGSTRTVVFPLLALAF